MKTTRKPRDIRSAKRQGWTVVEPQGTLYEKGVVSYLGLMIWTDRNAKGRYVSSFQPTRFAFESERDASWFLLRWS